MRLAEVHAAYGSRAAVGSLERILRVTFACNQKCPFCFVPPGDRLTDLAEIERELDRLAAAGGRGALTISGGEPTADPRLPGILALARRRGFRRFALQTNATLLGGPGAVERLARLGVASFMVSLHAPEPGLYDRVTGSRGLFPRAVAGLRAVLAEPRCGVSVNVVVSALNYRSLPRIAALVGALADGRRRVSLCFSMLNEVSHEKAPACVVDLDSVRPFLRDAMRTCRRAGLRVARFGGESAFPPCLANDPRRAASARPLDQRRVRYLERPGAGEAASDGRAKRLECRRCPFDARCLGVPAAYARVFGLEALKR